MTGVVVFLGAEGLRSVTESVSRYYVLKPLGDPVAVNWTALFLSTLAYLISASEAGTMVVVNVSQMSTVRKNGVVLLVDPYDISEKTDGDIEILHNHDVRNK